MTKSSTATSKEMECRFLEVYNVKGCIYIQGWKSMLFKSKDESIVYTKSKDIRNKKQRLVLDAEIRTKIVILFFIRMYQNFCRVDY